MLLSVALALSVSADNVTAEERPDWQEPEAGNFENWVVMLVKIEDALLPYVSADDMMALFVGDELRGLSRPSVVVSTGEVDATQFLLKAFSNESYGDKVVCTLKYYNAKLKQVFSLTETITIDEKEMFGFDKDFIPPFTQGSAAVVTGDATGDGVVDVSDYIGIANYILGNVPEGFNEKAADVNGDGIVDVSDYIGVANLILYGSVNGK
jgi:hypothetical protein